ITIRLHSCAQKEIPHYDSASFMRPERDSALRFGFIHAPRKRFRITLRFMRNDSNEWAKKGKEGRLCRPSLP
ncbi:MAG TPA: hypothetical protein VFF35_16040, partial [Bacteroidia bacterium]|nr:hypothetical protein [Bacteroidia bacterium]